MKKIKFLKGTICLAVSLCLALSSIPVLAEEELPGVAMDIEASESSDNSDILTEDDTVETEDSLTEEFMGEDIEPSETLPETEISSEKANHANDAVMTAEETAALSISVDYIENISCGQEIIFTVNASGGSGNYKYRLAGLMTVEDGQLVSVYDISYGNNGSYRENNEFGFTFYASGTYYIRFSVMDMTTFETKTTGLYEYTLNIQDANYPSVMQIVKTVAAQCKNECATDFEKALWLHDWILDKGDYDYSYSYCSAEGVLARGEGTCESYHRAYVLLLNEVGIATGRITGNGHVWTAVKMDGEWYQVDTTWDDGGEQMKGTIYEHMYFGVTDEIIGLVHTDHQLAVPGYESTALENNYFIKTGQVKQWSDSFVDTIKQNLANGEIKFVLNVNSSMPDNYKNVIYNLVAYELSKTDWNGKELDIFYTDDCLTCEVKAGADDETVVGANYSGCVGQDIVLRFSAGTGQYYTLSSGSEYGVIINQFYRKTSSSEMLGVSESYTNECTLRFDSVGKYNIVLTGNTANDSIAFCIDVREHEWSTEYTVDKSPTCTEKGSQSIHCKVCDSIKPDSMKNIDAKGHVPGDWQIAQEATEDTEGTRIKYCQVCKKQVEWESIPKIETYYVTYDANGGVLPISNGAGETYTTYRVRECVGDKHTIDLDSYYSPERLYKVTYHGNGQGAKTFEFQDYFKFLGWNTKKDGSGKTYKAGDVYSENKDITLYAQWSTMYFSDRYVERSGYVFKGWYTQKQGGKKVTSKTVIKGNTDVYAQWEPGKFSLDAKQIIVDIGDIKTITASVTSEQELFDVSCNWDGGTQNRQIIYADGHMNTVSVQGLHEGEANVYVSIKNSGVYLPLGVSKEAQCKVIVKGFVWRLYETLLKREADIAGWKAWLQQLDTGAITGAQAAEGFIFSDEFVNQNLSNDEFVERMYATFLNRPSDPKGKAEWVDCLESGVSRRGIFYGFAESLEFTQLCEKYGIIRGNVELTEARDKNVGITKFISRLYTKALERNTDVQGLNAWADVILSGRETPEKVAFGILFSDEFKNKGLSNEEYLNVLYRVFMGREADPSGFAAWKKMLDEGWRRDVIFYGFSKSDEFSGILNSFGLQQTVGEAVYVARTEEKYHTANCSRIRDIQTNILLLQDARSIGYEACSECH